MDLSIIILSFKNVSKLRVTLHAVLGSVTHFSYEVIVVDNDSKDGCAEMVEAEFPSVKLIRNANNGFSKGNNLGLNSAQGKYILFLNPDTAVEANVLEECLKRFIADPRIGMLSCKLVKADGSLDLAARRSFPNPINSFFRFSGLARLFPSRFGGYNKLNIDANKEQEVDAVSGAFMLTSKEVIVKAGSWDEEFFMYGEDIDFCYRVKAAGYKVIYFPKVTTIHYKGQSSAKTPYLSLYHFHNSMWIFYKKHYLKKYSFAVNGSVFIAIWLRFYVLLLINKLRKNPYVSK
ncbi:MAG: glycosyltransferase family 2 protein [Candidatus Doudnabacteria bacterium]